MIITCPQCSSQFNVNDSMITSTGRKVQCSNCAHQWRVFLSTEGEAVNEATPQPAAPKKQVEAHAKKSALASKVKAYSAPKPPSSLVNAPRFKKSAIAAFIAGLICLITVNLFTNQDEIIDALPFTRTLYSALNLTHDAGIKLQAVDCQVSNNSDQGDGLVELDVKVDLINSANMEQKLSNVRFSVYDKEKNFLGDYTIEFNKIIAPNAIESIEGRLNRIPDSAMFAIIDIGGSREIMIRDRNYISHLVEKE